MSTNVNWRIRPTTYVQHHVQQIAVREGRSLSNTMHKLLTEAIDARRKGEASVDQLIATIRGITGDTEPAA
jgi:hypothetical protein